MGSKSSMDILPSVQHGRALVLDTAVEASNGVVSCNYTFEIDGKIWSLSEIVDINGVRSSSVHLACPELRFHLLD
jgi:hypothetical protein